MVVKKLKTKAKGTIAKMRDDVVQVTEIGEAVTFDKPHATVRVSQGTTLNMGNYQSLRLGVDVTLPCAVDKLDKAFIMAKKFVEKHLEEMVGASKDAAEIPAEVADTTEDFEL